MHELTNMHDKMSEACKAMSRTTPLVLAQDLLAQETSSQASLLETFDQPFLSNAAAVLAVFGSAVCCQRLLRDKLSRAVEPK